MPHLVEKLEQLGDGVVLLAPAGQQGISWRVALPQASSAKLIEFDLVKGKKQLLLKRSEHLNTMRNIDREAYLRLD